ncbi:MAG: DNRLRE domain-containing protein, partial [Planctomycetes bacterium]|nr:DNRLRE domain-containing protein [Planctomycetota bacterium]
MKQSNRATQTHIDQIKTLLRHQGEKTMKNAKPLAWKLLSVLVVLSMLMSVMPVLVARAQGPITLNPDQDSYVYVFNGDTNYGTEEDLRVRKRRSWGTNYNRRTFIRFALPASLDDSVINSATLRLYMYDAPSSNRTYQAHRVNGSWGEYTITYGNAPGVTGSPSTEATGSSDDVWLEWDVTSDVQLFVNGTSNNHGWRIRDSAESSSGSIEAYFRSREYGTTPTEQAFRPELVIDYTPSNNAPTLSYSAETGYITDGVNPDSGDTSTPFTYKVVYTDSDGDAPSYVRAVIDGTDQTMSVDTSAAAALQDGDYTNGEQYIYSTTLSRTTHNYYFTASDGTTTVNTSTL